MKFLILILLSSNAMAAIPICRSPSVFGCTMTQKLDAHTIVLFCDASLGSDQWVVKVKKIPPFTGRKIEGMSVKLLGKKKMTLANGFDAYIDQYQECSDSEY